jgi:SRSO17 transposase
MTPAELARVRRRLVAFAAEVFQPLARADQRRWGECYLRGLMLDGKGKSIQPMAERLPDGNEQALQQFLSQSPWDWRPVRQRLATQMTAAVDPDAWIVDDTGFPKFGNASVGVARQYSGTLGKVANCQVGVSIHAATDQASCPIDWRLFLPESWDQDAARRRAAHLPEAVGHRPKGQLVLDMLDELAAWDLAPPVVVADAGYGESGELRLGLEGRGLA